jgi:iron complex transport system substrate-binding protein
VTRRWARPHFPFRLLLLALLCCPAVVSAISAMPEPAAAAATPSGAAGNGVPTRILCLSASATQMLYAMGAGHQVVGVDKYSTYPPGTPLTKFTGAETSAEDYLYLKPDLVIFAYKTNVVQQLKDLGIPSLVLSPPLNFAGVYSQIAELGAATGHDAAASALVASLQGRTQSLVRAAGGAGRGGTYYIELDPNYYYTATSRTFIGAEFSLFGMKDIADPASHGSAYPAISAEYLLKANPDYVFLADTVCCHQTAETFAKRPGFGVLRAVRLHRVVGVNDSVASQWGPHTIEGFVSLLARTLR